MALTEVAQRLWLCERTRLPSSTRRTNHVVKDVPIDGRPVAIAANAKGVYVVDRHGIVWRIDPVKRRVVGRIGVSGDVHDLALGFGSVWLADGTDGTVTRIDDQLSRWHTISLGQPSGDAPAFWITASGGAVWATHGDFVAKIDPATNKVVGEPFRSRARPAWPAGSEPCGSPRARGWTESTPAPRPSPNQYSLPGPVRGADGRPTPRVGDRRLPKRRSLGVRREVDPGQGVPAKIVTTSVGRYPLDLAVTDEAIWTVDTQGLVSRIDLTEQRVVRDDPDRSHDSLLPRRRGRRLVGGCS